MRNRIFAYVKTKVQFSCAVTAQLIIAFVFATRTVQVLLYLYPKFQDSSFILWMYRPFCVDLVGNPEGLFSRDEAHIQVLELTNFDAIWRHTCNLIYSFNQKLIL